jgi:hypothetical protein
VCMDAISMPTAAMDHETGEIVLNVVAAMPRNFIFRREVHHNPIHTVHDLLEPMLMRLFLIIDDTRLCSTWW